VHEEGYVEGPWKSKKD